MTINSLFLFAPAETATPDSGACAYAVGLAKEFGARLTVFVVALDVTTPGGAVDAGTVAGSICAAAQAAGVDCLTVTEHSHAMGVHEVIAEHARMHDLTVTGCNGSGLLSERQIAEHLLFESGRPVLVVPPQYTAPYAHGSAVVAWDNTPAAARALGDARPLIAGEEVVFLTVDGDKQIQGDLGSEQISKLSARRGLRVRHLSVDRHDRDIAEALQDETRTLGAGLLVMGAYGHSRLRRYVLGSATVGLLENLHVPTLLSH